MATPISVLPFKIAKKIYAIANPDSSLFGRNWKIFPVKEYANDLIYNALNSEKPLMIARLGANEINCMINYLGVNFQEKFKNKKSYIKGQAPAWWWNKNMMDQMCNVAGFFPKETQLFSKFSKMMIEDLSSVDILGSWLKEETFFKSELVLSKKVMLEDLEPFFINNPWTKALEGKKVLVVHPFASTIQTQYTKRELLFDIDVLPEFELKVLKAVQSYASEKTPFSDWFEALEHMKDEIEKTDFDICILGCGAYGFPLAAHIKRMGKKSLHLGGATQLLFGIKGKRWENYIVYPYTNLYNSHWVRPDNQDKPQNVQLVEGGCYW